MLRRVVCSFLAALCLGVGVPCVAGAQSAPAPVATGESGLPVPRFVSLKASQINVRRGPGRNYDVAFTFVRPGLPVEITQEFDNWRKVRDQTGEEGWIFHSLLSGRRTVTVAPWEKGELLPLRRSAAADAPLAAQVEPNVLANVAECTGAWCLIRGEGYEGWIEQDKLWGVYPGEEIDD